MREGASRLVRAFFMCPENHTSALFMVRFRRSAIFCSKTADPDNLFPSGSVHPCR
jgi:hypothetical protein